ncbi:unnamed protein product [Schistocephalus solidus]|uniref:Uncharacterized protein n=1 Tax=Schistocephalus solidus TaxID=70667 RepID=A0A183SN53_SCHSO|nr:unnamed protein product [Schistocephalus solidus]
MHIACSRLRIATSSARQRVHIFSRTTGNALAGFAFEGVLKLQSDGCLALEQLSPACSQVDLHLGCRLSMFHLSLWFAAPL